MLQISGSVISAPEFHTIKDIFGKKCENIFVFISFIFEGGTVSVSAEYWDVGNGAIMILSEYVLCFLQLINLSPADAR